MGGWSQTRGDANRHQFVARHADKGDETSYVLMDAGQL